MFKNVLVNDLWAKFEAIMKILNTESWKARQRPQAHDAAGAVVFAAAET